MVLVSKNIDSILPPSIPAFLHSLPPSIFTHSLPSSLPNNPSLPPPQSIPHSTTHSPTHSFTHSLSHPRWVLHGELHDSFKEFFVGCKSPPSSSSFPSSSSSGTNMWLDAYFMRSSMLPTFLSPVLAERALVIGKSINFIRLCIQKCPKSSTVKIKDRRQVRYNRYLLY